MAVGEWSPENHYLSSPWQSEVQRLERVLALTKMEMEEFKRYNRALIVSNAKLRRQLAAQRGPISTTNKRGGYKLGTRALRGK